ncbi:MAG: SDR family oxidoreductase [Bacteroidales bacterium]
MKHYFKDKVTIITGASSGIGKALAFEFARNESIVILAARSEHKLIELETQLRTEGVKAMAVPTDVTKAEDCHKLILKTVKEFGRIDILINNAGISMKALFHETDINVLQRVMDVNFWGTVYCTHFALPYLIERRGTLVAVTSIGGYQGLPGRSGYSASKFAVQGLFESIRVENLKKGLNVIIIAPGFTSSEIRKHALLADGSEQGESPRNEEKLVTPESVAKKILKSIVGRKRNKIMTLEGNLTVLLKRFLPGLVDRGYYREFAKEPNSILK